MGSAVLLAGVPAAAWSQQDSGASVQGMVHAGGAVEEYLRYLQISGTISPYPWSVRGFSAAELNTSLATAEGHPWEERYDLRADRRSGQLELLWPELELFYNSGFAHGGNDGVVWKGRGLTSAVRMGVFGRYGPFSLSVAPVAFHSQNRAFELHPNGEAGLLRYGAWREPRSIDLPQRFGDAAFWRIDPGESTLRIDWRGMAIGASTAVQSWGPASSHAVLLGNNAPGFPHAFIGTARPANLWIGRLHGRLVWGQLHQSEFSPVQDEPENRFMSGLVAVFTPRGVPGLELGLARFFHDTWPTNGISRSLLLRPLEGFIKSGLNETPELATGNQLVSAFVRWAVPSSGFEVYGEFGREDHSWSIRHFLLEPDDIGAYMVGFRKSWSGEGQRLVGLRGEVYNSETSHLELTDRIRGQSPMYLHYSQRQGHTHVGQMLASRAGFGGAAAVLGVDVYHGGGRWTAEWERTLRAFQGDYADTGVIVASGRDVAHSMKLETMIFGGAFDVTAALSGTYNFDRNFQQDVVNLGVGLRVDMVGH